MDPEEFISSLSFLKKSSKLVGQLTWSFVCGERVIPGSSACMIGNYSQKLIGVKNRSLSFSENNLVI